MQTLSNGEKENIIPNEILKLINENQQVKTYWINKAAELVKKAQEILKQLELDNSKTDGDIHSILKYCSWLILCERQIEKMRHKTDRTQNDNDGSDNKR